MERAVSPEGGNGGGNLNVRGIGPKNIHQIDQVKWISMDSCATVYSKEVKIVAKKAKRHSLCLLFPSSLFLLFFRRVLRIASHAVDGHSWAGRGGGSAL